MTDTVNVPREVLESAVNLLERAYTPDPRFGSPALDAMRAMLAAAPKAEPDELKDPDAVEHYDDGSKVVMDGYAGGAHVLGAWGKLTLRFIAANGAETVREYTADDIRQAEASKVGRGPCPERGMGVCDCSQCHRAPASDELLSVIIELVEHFERVDGDAEHKALIGKATNLYARHKGPQS